MAKNYTSRAKNLTTRQIKRKLKMGNEDIITLYEEMKKGITPFLSENPNDKMVKVMKMTMDVIDEEIQEAEKNGDLKELTEKKMDLKIMSKDKTIEKYTEQLLEIKKQGTKFSIR